MRASCPYDSRFGLEARSRNRQDACVIAFILFHPRLPFCLRHAYFLSSAVVSERFFNFLPNFALQFPEKDVEEARDRCRIHGICFEFFDIPMSFPGIPVSARLRKEPDA